MDDDGPRRRFRPHFNGFFLILPGFLYFSHTYFMIGIDRPGITRFFRLCAYCQPRLF